MKFCDKLARMRKNNNLSQEQFADKMGVSRQAVSKWESGQSIPDMEKIMTMCKLLNCNLDDLLDDGVMGKSKQNDTKLNFGDYFNEFLSFITKSYNMIWSMRFKEKIKCIFEMLFIFLILLLSGIFLNYMFNSLIVGHIYYIPYIGSILSRVLSILFLIALVCIGVVVFIHLFKIRYLDYYVTVEDSLIDNKRIEKELPNEKIIDNKKYIVEPKKEKIVIRDPKHSSYNFFSLLGNLFVYIIKFFTVLFSIPVIIFTLIVLALTACSIYYFKYGLLFLFVFICLIGCLLMCYIILYYIYNFIFNCVIKFKRMFILFIISLCLMGIGFGFSFVKYMDYDRVGIDDNNYIVDTFDIDYNDNVVISPYRNNIEYVIDDSLSSIKVEVKHYKENKVNMKNYISGDYKFYDIYSNGINSYDYYRIFKEDLKKHKIRNLNDEVLIKVYLSSNMYNVISNNNSMFN